MWERLGPRRMGQCDGRWLAFTIDRCRFGEHGWSCTRVRGFSFEAVVLFAQPYRPPCGRVFVGDSEYLWPAENLHGSSITAEWCGLTAQVSTTLELFELVVVENYAVVILITFVNERTIHKPFGFCLVVIFAALMTKLVVGNN